MVTINKENKNDDVKENNIPPKLAKILKDLEDHEAGYDQALHNEDFKKKLPKDYPYENLMNYYKDKFEQITKELQAFIDDPLNEKTLNSEIKEILAKKGIAIKDPEFIAETLTKTTQDIVTPALKEVTKDLTRMSKNIDNLNMTDINETQAKLIKELDQTFASLDESKGSTSKQIFEQLKQNDGADEKDHPKYEKFAEEITEKKINALSSAIKKIKQGVILIFNGLKSIFQNKEQQIAKENSKGKEENKPKKSWVAEEKERKNTPDNLTKSR